MSTLNQTTVPHRRLDAPPRGQRRHPLELFTDYAVAARLWFGVALVTSAYAVVAPYLVIRAHRTKERVVILDAGGTYHVSPLLGFEDAGKLHESHALLACLALWSRHPGGADYPELLERLFLPDALREAREAIARTAEEFAAKSLHQKPEVLKLTVLETRADTVLVQVEGQWIRTGLFQGRPFSEAPAFTARFTFARNPNLGANARYPLAVWKFDVSS
ncbi:MAG: hypothetical protein Q8M02_13245 [Candidatus Didemnitutus sp.]|nr:hypothetical protein [Candidatus Didemnitutus sp.]